MKEQRKINVAASIRQRLFNIAKENGEDFLMILTRFANERFLYRLGLSEHASNFLLKGGTLLTLWFKSPRRPTRDIDLLGLGSKEIVGLEKIIEGICGIGCEDDGLVFDPKSVRASEIRQGEQYQGVRFTFLAYLEKARIAIQVDVGFGDAVTPRPKTVNFPTILDLPHPRLAVYPKETVVAEKFEAMVKLGIVNSRMKDFWDLDLMIEEFEFNGETLQRAITATLRRRKTNVPKRLPLALTSEFAIDAAKQTQWKAFLGRNGMKLDKDLSEVVRNLGQFFEPILNAIDNDERFENKWKANRWVQPTNEGSNK